MTNESITPSSLACTWTPLQDLWPHVEQNEGSLTRVRADDERLFLLAAALPDAVQGGWRTSFILDEVHLGHRGFPSQVEAQHDAEQMLTLYLRQHHLLPEPASPARFDTPEEHILAQVATMLDDDWHIVHISEYKREWIVVCINHERTEVEDFAFTYDSFGVLGERERLGLSQRCDLASLALPKERVPASFPSGGVPDTAPSSITDDAADTPLTIIDWFLACDDSEHFPIREWVRQAIASGKTVEETAMWLEAEAQKRSHEVLSHLPWMQIARHFHEDVGELVAYEQANGLSPTEEPAREEEADASKGTKEQPSMIPDDELYLTETQDPATHHWPYSATLKGTRLTLYSQYSIEGAIGYVQKAMIEGFKGSYAPVVLSYRHKMMIISRDVHSRIAIDLLDVPGEQMALKFLDHQMSGYSTWADAHKDARFRLSQATWNGVEEESEPLVGYAAAQAQFGNWARKQKVERAASTDGREVLAQEGDQESRSR